jgi:hypothetical protein
MIRRNIHDQHYSPGRVLLDQQLFQEVDKLSAVLSSRRVAGNLVTLPGIPTKDVSSLLYSWLRRRNVSLLPNLHPKSSQRRIKAQRSFVHKDELEIVSRVLFLNSSSSSSSFTLASLSCKWPRSCFGQQYRYLLAFNNARKRA